MGNSNTIVSLPILLLQDADTSSPGSGVECTGIAAFSQLFWAFIRNTNSYAGSYKRHKQKKIIYSNEHNKDIFMSI